MACWDAAQAEKQPEIDELKAEVERLEAENKELREAKVETIPMGERPRRYPYDGTGPVKVKLKRVR